MTRFGKISPLCQILKLFGNLLKVYEAVGKILNLLGDFFANSQIFIEVNGQMNNRLVSLYTTYLPLYG